MTMKFKIAIRPRAKRDLAEIQEYLSQFYKSTPKKFMEAFWDTVNTISFSPWNVKWRWNHSYRCALVQRKYAVIYRVDEEANIVRIHRVLHGSRNFRRGLDVEVMEERAEYQTMPVN